MKYALFGYTYQHYVACLLLAMMDVERSIDQITLEAAVDHKFDDIVIASGTDKYFLQIKDIEGMTVGELKIENDSVTISGKEHKLSNHANLLLFKSIKLKPNCKILGFDAQKIDNVYLVSINREQVEKRIVRLHGQDIHRRQVLDNFFSTKLDERILDIHKTQLPSMKVFETRLAEKNVILARKILDFEDVLHIEGKPGVGKSHFVSYLQQQYRDNVLYRFWVSNQDRQYEDRLRYSSFKSDLIKKIFLDQKERSEEDILERLEQDKSILIIDGLDHIENYRPQDLKSFIEFIDRAKARCKVIVLSRPLRTSVSWKKQTLRNWNGSETRKILKKLYLIDDYTTYERIYKITEGYPILVKYIAEQCKKEGRVPAFATLDTVNAYYDQIFEQVSGKKSLALFLCCRGFLMRSEVSMFLGDYAGAVILEFIDERPYLFELKLNRISLYHDSLITYLRNSGLDFKPLLIEVNKKVAESLLAGEARFQSRIGHFDLPVDYIARVIKWYSSIENFKRIMPQVIDFEAVQEFYMHLRELLSSADPAVLTISQYYDLALILNISSRDHFSTLNGFYYTYTKMLLKHGYSEENVTSSKYLFGMLLYIRCQDGSFLHDMNSEGMYDTRRFYQELDDEVELERNFFEYHSRPFRKSSIEKALADHRSIHYKDDLVSILSNVYLHKEHHTSFAVLADIVGLYLDGEESKAAMMLKRQLSHTGLEDFRLLWRLEEVKIKLLALGIRPESNDYLNLTLKEYLNKHKEKGAFKLWPELLSYLRLAEHQNRTIDISSVSAFWTKYYQRHDYSFWSLDHAFTVLEEKGYIDWKDSIKLLKDIQEKSEKGYRSIMMNYFMFHEPEFILDVLEEFDVESLRVEWFLLGVPYINVLPDYVYQHEIGEQLYYHRHRQEIEIQKIQNLLNSNKCRQLKEDLDFGRYTVTLKSGDSRVSLLKKNRIKYRELTGEEKYREDKSEEERFNEGILDRSNRQLILEKGLTPVQVALMPNTDQMAIAYPELFEVFEKPFLQTQIHEILFASLTGRSRYGDSFQNPCELPGNLLKLVSAGGIATDFDALAVSFISFLELSMYSLPVIKKLDSDKMI